jgi:hypothetical protein
MGKKIHYHPQPGLFLCSVRSFQPTQNIREMSPFSIPQPLVPEDFNYHEGEEMELHPLKVFVFYVDGSHCNRPSLSNILETVKLSSETMLTPPP